MDCFASLAMTGSPRRGALHGGLTGRIRGPQFHADAGIIGVDAELRAFEQGLQAAIAESLRRRSAVKFCREFDDEGRLQRAMKNQAGIALDPGDVVAVVMDAVAVESQRRETKQKYRVGHVAFAVFG